jgi:hypothetical protein
VVSATETSWTPARRDRLLSIRFTHELHVIPCTTETGDTLAMIMQCFGIQIRIDVALLDKDPY